MIRGWLTNHRVNNFLTTNRKSSIPIVINILDFSAFLSPIVVETEEQVPVLTVTFIIILVPQELLMCLKQIIQNYGPRIIGAVFFGLVTLQSCEFYSTFSVKAFFIQIQWVGQSQ